MALISRNAKPKPSSWRKAGPRGAGQEWQRFNHAAGSEALPFARATEVVGRFAVSVKRKTKPSSWRKAGPRGVNREWKWFNHAADSEAPPFAWAT